jgi:hypothetical protein
MRSRVVFPVPFGPTKAVTCDVPARNVASANNGLPSVRL